MLTFILWEEKEKHQNTKICVRRRIEKIVLGKVEGKELSHLLFFLHLSRHFVTLRVSFIVHNLTIVVFGVLSSFRVSGELECNLTGGARTLQISRNRGYSLGISYFTCLPYFLKLCGRASET